MIPSWFREEHKRYLVSARRETKTRVLQSIAEIEWCLDQGGSETDIQALLKQVPETIGGGYRLGHGTYAFPEVSFPPEYRLDWLVASGTSAGFEWNLIELEDPRKTPYLKSGHYSDSTRKGINQIKDW